MVGATVRVTLLFLGVVLAAGCGQAAHSASSARGMVYHVSIAVRGPDGAGVFSGSVEHGTAWLDPAGQRFRVASIDPGQVNSHRVGVRTLDVGAPGVDETTTDFPGDASAGMSGAQTTLEYGMPGGNGDDLGMSVLRSYLGYPVKGAPRFTVSHVGGRVRLTWGFPDVGIARLKSAGLPASFLKKLIRATQHAQIVMTILGTSTQGAAHARGLFTVNAARADIVIRTTRPGVKPPGSVSAYWLGPVWDGNRAQRAVVTTSKHEADGGDSYQLSYGDGTISPAGVGTLSVSTEASPPGMGSSSELFGHDGPFGAHGQRIRLRDGERATFFYHRFPLRPTAPRSGSATVKDSLSLTVGSASVAVDGLSATTASQASTQPPLVMIVTHDAQIILVPATTMTRAQALGIAELLRPV
jgi:hypothetical protein